MWANMSYVISFIITIIVLNTKVNSYYLAKTLRPNLVSNSEKTFLIIYARFLFIVAGIIFKN